MSRQLSATQEKALARVHGGAKAIKAASKALHEAIEAAAQKFPSSPLSSSSVEAGEKIIALKYAPLKIERVVIENFRGIRKVDITMPTPSKNEPPLNYDISNLRRRHARADATPLAPCLILWGDNAAGKTDTLMAISLALLPDNERRKLSLPPPEKLVHQRRNEAFIVVKTNRGDFTLTITKSGFRREAPKDAQATELRPLLLAYGAIRDIHPGTASKPLKNCEDVSPVCNLFGGADYLLDAEWWGEHDKEILNIAMRLIPHTAVLLEKDEGKPMHETRARQGVAENLSVRDLSAGHKAVISLVCDMICKLQKLSGVPVAERKRIEAIVLIDEPELHLHLTWKHTLLNKLREEFPKTVFIIATQGCFLASSGKDGEIRQLYRENAASEVAVKPILACNLLRQSMSEILDSPAFGAEG